MPTVDETRVSAEHSGDPLAGTPYRTTATLGAGGMGEVVEAEHVTLGKRVVVKLLKKTLADDALWLERFRFEAQVLARLCHPNLVDVTDLGRTGDGRPYFVMERLRGRTLSVELQTWGALPVASAIEIMRQVLAGLGEAHRHGLVHRDVKLDNIFLCDAGGAAPEKAQRERYRVKLLDFGIAKAGQRGAETPIAAAPAYPTQEGTTMGTPRYIAPEQIRGRTAVDARADLYAAGVVLYVLVAGRGPFQHKSTLALLDAHLNESPKAPSSVAPQPIPAELDRAILCALAKRPEDRFVSAEAFAEELGRILDRLTEVTQPLEAATNLAPQLPPPCPERKGPAPELRTQRLPDPGSRTSLPTLPTKATPQLVAPSAGRNARRPSLLAIGGTFVGSAVCFWILIMLALRLTGWR
ncbi:MAG: serine/threonine-protein kinase [Polyangiaceae bacterium]